jgi:asparagine N-glycosylation enzyme membrane subunit Stt3
LVAAIYAPTALSQMQRGDMSILVFFTVLLSSILLAIGGFMHFRKARASVYWFFAAALFFAIVYLQWRPTFVFTGFMIATCAGLVSVVAMRRLAKV